MNPTYILEFRFTFDKTDQRLLEETISEIRLQLKSGHRDLCRYALKKIYFLGFLFIFSQFMKLDRLPQYLTKQSEANGIALDIGCSLYTH